MVIIEISYHNSEHTWIEYFNQRYFWENEIKIVLNFRSLVYQKAIRNVSIPFTLEVLILHTTCSWTQCMKTVLDWHLYCSTTNERATMKMTHPTKIYSGEGSWSIFSHRPHFPWSVLCSIIVVVASRGKSWVWTKGPLILGEPGKSLFERWFLKEEPYRITSDLNPTKNGAKMRKFDIRNTLNIAGKCTMQWNLPLQFVSHASRQFGEKIWHPNQPQIVGNCTLKTQIRL